MNQNREKSVKAINKYIDDMDYILVLKLQIATNKINTDKVT